MSVAPESEEPLFPFGYRRPPDGGPQGMGTMLTWKQMTLYSTVNRLHGEVLRRFKSMIHAAYDDGVNLGCGTGWRIQPNPPPAGFAKPGNSWHESCPISPTSPTALAIDTVPNTGWPWMEANSTTFGLRTFRYVNKEPWHVQPMEINASRRYATVLPPLTVWNLPGTVVPPIPPIPPPNPATGVFVVQSYRKKVQEGSQGKMAKFCQQQINLIAGQGIPEDGDFGPRSVQALKNVQTVLGLTPDGQCGPKTWQGLEDAIRVQAESGDWD